MNFIIENGFDGLGPIKFCEVRWARRASRAQPGRWSLPPTVAWLAGLRACGAARVFARSPTRSKAARIIPAYSRTYYR